jgi:hypothetical protein
MMFSSVIVPVEIGAFFSCGRHSHNVLA